MVQHSILHGYVRQGGFILLSDLAGLPLIFAGNCSSSLLRRRFLLHCGAQSAGLDLLVSNNLVPCRFSLWLSEGRRLPFAFASSIFLHVLGGLVVYAGGSFTTPESVTAGPFVYVRLVGVSEVKLVMSGRNGAKSGKTLSSEASHDLNRISLDPVSVDGEVSAKVLEPAVQVAKPESKYFSSDKLTTRPYPLTHLEIRDIPEMHLGELSGKLVLKVWIDANGDVAATESEFTDLPLSVHEAAVAAFRRMRFSPGQINGQPVGSVIEIEIVPDSLGFPLE